ncbi:MAG TPA: hypothetical protein VF950_27755 [Planctomycetota bacterium]
MLLALLLQIAPPALGTHDPIKNWKYDQKVFNPKNGRNEIRAELTGEEATPIDVRPKNEVFEVKGVVATYYLDPRPPRTDKVELIRMSARRARMDNAAGVLRLQERVRVERPGLPGEPPSLLMAPEAVVTFHPEFVCSRCGARGAAKGSCAACAQPFSERMSVTVQAPRDFDLVGPEGGIRGERLVADEAMTDIAVDRQGYFEVVGDPQNLAHPAAGRPRRVISQLSCRGPLRIRETSPGRRTVVAREGVRLDRLDETGTQTALAESMVITLGSRVDPVTLKSTPVIERVEAAGDVRLCAVTFVDGREVSARAETMTLEREDFEDFQVTRVRLEGSPVDVATGSTSVRAARVSLDQPFGAALFEGGVDARLQGFPGSNGAPVLLRSRTLAARLNPRGDDVDTLEANGDVRLEGLVGAGGGGRAAADRFVFDRASGQGRLESPRAVRLELGATLILAPVVALRDAGRTVILQGPKRIVFSQEREGRRDEMAASCEGDIVYDAGAGRMRMVQACRLRTSDFRMTAERVDVEIDPEKRELKGFTAREDVRVRRDVENVLLSGNRLFYEPTRREFRLRGSPHAVATQGRATMTTEEIVLIERVDAEGNTVPTTELRGGAQGVRILIPGETK